MSKDAIRINVDAEGIDRAMKALSHMPGQFVAAFRNATNRAASMGRTRASKIVRKKYTAKAKDIKKSLSLKRATRSDMMATLYASGHALTLSKYNYSPHRDTTGAARRKVRSTMKKDNKRVVDNGFVYTYKKDGQQYIWARTPNDPEYGIKRVSGSSVPRMMGNQHEEVEELIREAFQKRLDHEVEARLKGYVKPSRWKND